MRTKAENKISLTPDIIKFLIYRMSIKRFVLPIWVIFMIDNGLSVQEIALIAGISTIVAFILEVPSGSIADAMGHRRACVVANILMGLSMLLFLGGTFPWILAASAGYWGASTLMSGTLSALIFEHLESIGKAKQFQKLLGYSRSAAAFFSMFAVGIAGFTYTISPLLTFSIGAVIFFIGAAALSTFTDPPQKKSVQKQEGFTSLFFHFGSAVKNVKKEPRLLWLLITTGFILGFTVTAGEFQQIILNNLGVSTIAIGLIYTVRRAISGAFSPFIHLLTKYLSAPSIVTLMAFSTLAYYLVVRLSDSAIVVTIALIFVSFGWIVNGVILSDYRNRLTPTGSRATTLSLSNFTFGVVKLVGIAAIAGFTALSNIENAHFYMAGIFILLMITLLPQLHRSFAKNPL